MTTPAWLKLAVALAMLPSVASTQTLAVRPELLPGENWTYHEKNIKTGGSIIYRHEMQHRDGEVYVLRGNFDNGTTKRQQTVRRSPDLNRLRTVAGQQTDSGWFNFPLVVGKTWQSNDRWPNNQGYDELTYRVVGREKITVPAGTFSAIKIEGVGFWHYEEGSPLIWTYGTADRTTRALWFAPEVKSYVRFRTEVWWDGAIATQLESDLIAAEIKKGDSLMVYGSPSALSEAAKH